MMRKATDFQGRTDRSSVGRSGLSAELPSLEESTLIASLVTTLLGPFYRLQTRIASTHPTPSAEIWQI
jgi:hypothetical protein